MAHTSPTVARWELALRLKRRREELQMSVKTITDHLGFSRNYWSMVENEKASLADDKFKLLMELFDLDSATTAELGHLRDRSRERGWWDRVNPELDDDLRRLYGLENGATSQRIFSPLIVAGLLQTEEYARAIMSNDPAVSDIDLGRLLEIRMRRQEHLKRGHPARLHALMSEGALMQVPQTEDGNELLHEQLEHLVAVVESSSDEIALQVVPFTVGHGGLAGASTRYMLDFESDLLPTVMWHESASVRGFVEVPAFRRHLDLSYSQLALAALPTADTVDLIRAKIDHLMRA